MLWVGGASASASVRSVRAKGRESPRQLWFVDVQLGHSWPNRQEEEGGETITENQVKEQLSRGADLADEMIEAQTRRRNAVTDRPGVLIAEGDSWFDYPRYDIVKRLERQLGWDVESVARYGDNLESMAYDRAQLGPLTRAFLRVRDRGEVPRGLLLRRRQRFRRP